MPRRRIILSVIGLLTAIALVVFQERVSIAANLVRQRVAKRTVNDRLAEFGAAARNRLKPLFQKAGVAFPPENVVLVALKDEKVLELYTGAGTQKKLIHRYPILAASGGPGPKLREGDNQVPEGIYRIESLNPNSAYHVSLRVNYPNESDRAQAAKDGRTNLGGDIMIHGKTVSIGCIAVGDTAAEELFTLAADVGLKDLTVICAPTDFRKHKERPAITNSPAWVAQLYQRIAAELPTP
jgi:murein L,D-transpeptidase YafK